MIDPVKRFDELFPYDGSNVRDSAIRQLAAEIRAEENEACALVAFNILDDQIGLADNVCSAIRARMKEGK